MLSDRSNRLACKLFKKSVSGQRAFSTSAGNYVERKAHAITLANREECDTAAKKAIKYFQATATPEGCHQIPCELTHTSYQCQPLCGLANYVKVKTVFRCG